MMNEDIINEIMFKDPFLKNIYRGTFASDELLPLFRIHSCYIVNTGARNTQGEHWVAVYRHPPFIIYYDSLGLSPIYHKSINDQMCRSKGSIVYTLRRTQGYSSSLCGAYCIFVLKNLSRGLSFEEVLSYFQIIPNHNDNMICLFLKKFIRNYSQYCSFTY
jgi:hypothetical protein